MFTGSTGSLCTIDLNSFLDKHDSKPSLSNGLAIDIATLPDGRMVKMVVGFDTSEHLNINGKVMGKQTFDADVIIIGGGPAGATLGCLLTNGCHSAIIIERAVHPREHVGELITPSVNAVLHRIGLLPQIDAAGFIRREGVGWTLPIEGRPEVSRFPVAKYPAPRAL